MIGGSTDYLATTRTGVRINHVAIQARLGKGKQPCFTSRCKHVLYRLSHCCSVFIKIYPPASLGFSRKCEDAEPEMQQEVGSRGDRQRSPDVGGNRGSQGESGQRGRSQQLLACPGSS